MSEFTTIYIHGYESKGKPATLKERLNMRKTCGPYQWTPSRPGTGRGFYQSSEGLRVGDSTFELRLVLANELLPAYSRLADIEGYYTNRFEDETMKPIVARLPKQKGFLVGWTMGKGMCASLGADIYYSPDEAARAAHEDARVAADKEYEYQEQQIEDEREEE